MCIYIVCIYDTYIKTYIVFFDFHNLCITHFLVVYIVYNRFIYIIFYAHIS